MDMVPHRLRFAALLLALGAAIAAWLLAAYFHRRLPEPRKSGGGGFNAQNAARDLRQLTGFGPRPAGSYANDVQAVTFLRYKLLGWEFIKEKKKVNKKLTTLSTKKKRIR